MNASKHTAIVSSGLRKILVAVLAVILSTFGLVAAVAQEIDKPAAANQPESSGKDVSADNGGGCGCGPDNTSDGVFKTAIEYAKLIETELGVPPKVDLATSVEIPIYVDGKRVKGNLGIHCCDNPSLQKGDCMSGSSVGRYAGKTADGKPLPHVVWVTFCRHDGPSAVLGIDGASVQMIGYNTETGATAFFEAGDNRNWIYVDSTTNRVLGVLPGIDDPEAFNTAYTTPGKLQCVQCHADPFIHNPFIDAARLPGDTTQPVVPEIAGADTPYYVIGASNWDMRTIHIEGNGCLECHRIGMKTIEEFVGDGWDPNEYMPPDDPGSMREDYQALLEAWKNGPENTPGFQWVIPPAGDCEGRVVGEDYPYKAEFNKVSQRELNKTPLSAPLPPTESGVAPIKMMSEEQKRIYFKALGMNEEQTQALLKEFGF